MISVPIIGLQGVLIDDYGFLVPKETQKKVLQYGVRQSPCVSQYGV